MAPKFGGGAQPCTLCSKSVYPAELVKTTAGYISNCSYGSVHLILSLPLQIMWIVNICVGTFACSPAESYMAFCTPHLITAF